MYDASHRSDGHKERTLQRIPNGGMGMRHHFPFVNQDGLGIIHALAAAAGADGFFSSG